MENKIAMYEPRKREDLQILLDRINSLGNAIAFKIEIEKQIDLNNKKVRLLAKKTLLERLRSILAPNKVALERVDRDIEVSKIRTQNENNEKMKLKYHANELTLEDDLEEVKKEMNVRFENYFSQLSKMYDQFRFGKTPPKDFPYEDLVFLLNKKGAEPPKTNHEKLALYLSMEELLYRCKKTM